jgi:hypothetical protein
MAKQAEYKLTPTTTAIGAKPLTMADGPGVERWIIDPPLTPEQCERVARMLQSAHAVGYQRARHEIQAALGIRLER